MNMYIMKSFARNVAFACCILGSSTVVNGDLSVMTMNQYFGADMRRLTQVDTECFLRFGFNFDNNVRCVGGKLVRDVLASNIEGRLKSQAAIIYESMPDVVGLQESGNLVIIDPDTNAVEVQYNSVNILLNELQSLGAKYKVAGKHQVTNVQNQEIFKFPLGFIRQDIQTATVMVYDTLLIRDELSARGVVSHGYSSQVVDLIKRGFVSAEVEVGGTWHKIVNTNLELEEEINIQQAQVSELLNELSEVDETMDTILLGEFNSRPEDDSYDDIVASSFIDMWLKNTNAEADADGFTGLQKEFLENPVSQLSERIDFIFYRGSSSQATSFMSLYGDSPVFDTPPLYPSDHAFVYGDLTFA